MNPRAFVLKCPKCRFTVFTSGVEADLKEQGLYEREIKKGCVNCGGSRVFKCQKCGTPTKAIRTK